MRIIHILLLLLFTSGCNSETSCFSENHKTYKDNLKIEDCSGELIAEDIFLTHGIACVGDYLVACSANREKLIFVYSLDGGFIGSYGLKGRASNEMLGIRFNGQVESSQSLLYTVDVNNRKLISIDLKSSITQDKLVMSRKYTTLPYGVNSFLLDDSSVLVEQQDDNNYRLNVLKGEEVDSTEELYLTPTSDPFEKYFSFCAISPNRKKLAWAMSYINQINILDLASRKRISRSIYLKPTMSNSDNLWVYYCNITVTDNYIYALYMNQSEDDSYSELQKSEIHVFNWDGKHIKNIVVDEYLYFFDVDDSDSNIYALDNERNLYRYKI